MTTPLVNKVLINCYYFTFYIDESELYKYNFGNQALNNQVLNKKHCENLEKIKNDDCIKIKKRFEIIKVKRRVISTDTVPILNPTFSKGSFLSYSLILFIKLFI